MTHSSISFLTLTAPEAVDLLGSLRTIDHLPESMADGVIDMIEALMTLLPAAAEIYHPLQDSMYLGEEFNHAQEAHRALVPALQEAVFPLSTPNGVFDADSPLTLALAVGNALALLRDLTGDANMSDREFDAIASMVDRLLDLHPSTKAAFDSLLDDPASGFDYVADALRMITAAQLENPQLAMAA